MGLPVFKSTRCHGGDEGASIGLDQARQDEKSFTEQEA